MEAAPAPNQTMQNQMMGPAPAQNQIVQNQMMGPAPAPNQTMQNQMMGPFGVEHQQLQQTAPGFHYLAQPNVQPSGSVSPPDFYDEPSTAPYATGTYASCEYGSFQ